jgi:hypothetical protein
LIWTPRITGLEWGFGGAQIDKFNKPCCTEVYSTIDKKKDPHFHWNMGYRMGVGTECNSWRPELVWTHFYSTGERHSDKNTNHPNRGRVKIQLDQIDLVATYICGFPLDFSIHPFIGIRTTQLKEKLHASSSVEIHLQPNILTIETKSFKHHQNYIGIGPLIGLELAWDFNCDLKLFGVAAASLLYGKYHIHECDSDLFNTPLTRIIDHSNKKNLKAFDGNIDLTLGLLWHLWSSSCFNLDTRFSIEHHQYFNQSMLGSSHGDISFSGGSFAFEFIF